MIGEVSAYMENKYTLAFARKKLADVAICQLSFFSDTLFAGIMQSMPTVLDTILVLKSFPYFDRPDVMRSSK